MPAMFRSGGKPYSTEQHLTTPEHRHGGEGPNGTPPQFGDRRRGGEHRGARAPPLPQPPLVVTTQQDPNTIAEPQTVDPDLAGFLTLTHTRRLTDKKKKT